MIVIIKLITRIRADQCHQSILIIDDGLSKGLPIMLDALGPVITTIGNTISGRNRTKKLWLYCYL
jgi:hypothetical protein